MHWTGLAPDTGQLCAQCQCAKFSSLHKSPEGCVGCQSATEHHVFVEYFRLMDHVPGSTAEEWRRGTWMGRPTGELRPPRAGEFYLSGAIPEGYRAPSDYAESAPFYILKPVRVSVITTVTYREVDADD